MPNIGIQLKPEIDKKLSDIAKSENIAKNDKIVAIIEAFVGE